MLCNVNILRWTLDGYKRIFLKELKLMKVEVNFSKTNIGKAAVFLQDAITTMKKINSFKKIVQSSISWFHPVLSWPTKIKKQQEETFRNTYVITSAHTNVLINLPKLKF